MDITFKTLGKQKFSLSIDRHDYVEDLIIKVGNTIGQENLYRMNEGSLVAEYSLSTVLPVIGMVTQAD